MKKDRKNTIIVLRCIVVCRLLRTRNVAFQSKIVGEKIGEKLYPQPCKNKEKINSSRNDQSTLIDCSGSRLKHDHGLSRRLLNMG